MRRYIRADTPGAAYFFTLTLQDRRADWLVVHIDLLRAAFHRVKSSHPFHIDAIVVLPDHLHTLWTLPIDDEDFPMRWMLIKQGFSRGVAAAGVRTPLRGHRSERSIWQRRYWEHQIQDEDDFARHVDYIHFNPVKHGLVRRAADWPHSSFHRYVRCGLLPPDWGLATGPAGTFGE